MSDYNEPDFLRDYLIYSSGTEVPEMFHIFGAYFCLSTAVSRRVWLPFADRYDYANIYVVYVGGAGNGKSEALFRAQYLLAQVGDIETSASIETPEGMWRWAAGDSTTKPPIESSVPRIFKDPYGNLITSHPIAIIASELVNFIAPNPEGWMAALNDIFDCHDYKYRTKNKGTDTLTSPYITLLGALTTEVSASLQKSNIIGTGLLRRTFFQFGDRFGDDTEPVDWPEFTTEQAAARDRCVAHLKRLQTLTGEFTFTPAARAWWKAWYRTNHDEVRQQMGNLKSWFGTKPARLRELAMLSSLSQRSDLVIDIPHLEVPEQYLRLLEKDLPRIFGGVGRNELAAVAQSIADFVCISNMPTSFGALRSKFFNNCKPPTEFEDCLKYLIESEILWEFHMQRGTELHHLIGSPKVMAELVLRQASTLPATVVPPLLLRARTLLAGQSEPRDAAPTGPATAAPPTAEEFPDESEDGLPQTS